MYVVMLGPAALRAIGGLRWSDRAELRTALRTELIDGPNAACEFSIMVSSEIQEGRSNGADRVYTATPLSFRGYTAIHRCMTSGELDRLAAEQDRSAPELGRLVADILPAESAFTRLRPARPPG
jgi:hypothetical protein